MTALRNPTLVRELPDHPLERLSFEDVVDLGFHVFEEVFSKYEHRDDALCIIYAWKRGETVDGIEQPKGWTEPLERMLVELHDLSRLEREEAAQRYDDPHVVEAVWGRHDRRLTRSWIGQRLVARIAAPQIATQRPAARAPRPRARRTRSAARSPGRQADSDDADPAPLGAVRRFLVRILGGRT